MERFGLWKGEWSAKVGALRGAFGGIAGKARLRKLADSIQARAAISREGARRSVQVFHDTRRH
jgi:hypothetical protein